MKMKDTGKAQVPVGSCFYSRKVKGKMKNVGIKTMIKRVIDPFIDYRRERAHDRMKEKLKITSPPSIIASDCVGGGG